VLACGCARTGELRTERRSVGLEEAESVRADLSMSAGDISVGGGAGDLMDATFTYNVPRWKPEVTYTGLAEQRELTVRQPDVPGPAFGNVQNNWEVLLNDDVPMRLSVSNSSGDGQLDLGSLSVRSLFLEFSSGGLIMNLTGEWAANLDGDINLGSGTTTLVFPDDEDVYVEAETSSGDIDASGMTRGGDAYANEPY